MKTILKRLVSVVLVVMMMVTLALPASAAIKTKVSLNKTSATIYVGGSVTLKLNGTSGKIKWTTSNKKVATVSTKGKVKAKKAGTATITATNNKKNYKCKVTVKNPALDKTKLSVKCGKIGRIKLNGGKIKSAKSSNPFVATVTKSGKIKGKKAGTATITVTSTKKKKYTCKVTVFPWLSDTSLTMKPKGSKTLKLIGASMKSAKSTNTAVATVTNAGKITAKKDGTATITVIDTNRKTYTCKVTVKSPAASTYTVTFESSGGSAVPAQKVKKGNLVKCPDNPVKEGYLFVGWFTDIQLTQQFMFEYDTVTSNMTFYAKWIEGSEDSIEAEAVVQQIVIGYETGDNADSVTRNLTLPLSMEDISGVDITWSSSNTMVISDSGAVTRPDSDENAVVALTATAKKGNASAQKTFTVTVIHERQRDPDQLPNQSVIDIGNLNDNQDVNIDYSEDQQQVVSIEGQYSDIIIENVDDAIDAIQSNHTILGIENAEEELEIYSIASDEYGEQYTFTQTYEGYEVYGYGITASVDANGTSDFLNADLIATDKLEQLNLSPSISKQNAEEIVEKEYDSCTIDTNSTTLLIFAMGDYQTSPILAYQVIANGYKSNESVSEVVFVNSQTGSIIKTDSLMCSIDSTLSAQGTGKTETGEKVTFPVDFTFINPEVYWFTLFDASRNIQVYEKEYGNEVTAHNNEFSNKTAVSAYTSMQKVYDWYLQTLDRKSVDNNGMKLEIIVNSNLKNGNNNPYYNNAAWAGEPTNKFFYFKNKWDDDFIKNALLDLFYCTYAPCIDVAGHEFTHGVAQFVSPVYLGGYNHDYLSVIGEGYGDIMGCLIDGDWTIGEKRKILRDAADPESTRCPDRLSSQYYLDVLDESVDGDAAGHKDSTLLSHAAYLMSNAGMDHTNLAKLWYTSLSYGYTYSSDLYTVRRNVLQAAKHLGFSQNYIQIIKNAFDTEEIYGNRGVIQGMVKDSNDNALTNARICITQNNDLIKDEAVNSRDGSFNYQLDIGTYNITITAEGYMDFNSIITVNTDETTQLDITMIQEGTGFVNGTIKSATTGLVLSGVALNARSGWNTKSGDIIASATTNDSGVYSMNLDAGYYTLEMSCDGYTTDYLNITVKANETVSGNATICPAMTSDTYRVVLTWGESPSDLDSHLSGTAGDGTDFHIYYDSTYAYKQDRTEIGNLDVDDTTSYGPETITFKVDTTGVYHYYVYRYSSDGSLPGSSANVKVYNGTMLIADYNIDPFQSSSYQYWNVFTIKNGIFITDDEVSSDTTTSGLTIQSGEDEMSVNDYELKESKNG